MPTRILRDGILSSDKVDQLNAEEEVFFRRLMSIVDDYGRFEADARLLRSRCYPLRVERVTIQQIEEWLVATEKAGLLAVYSSEGKRYLEFFNLGKPRAEKSKFPDRKHGSIRMNTGAAPVTDVPYSNSVSDSGTYSSASAKPHTPALTKAEWAQPDIHEIAFRLARELSALHWCSSEIPQAEAAMIRELVRAADALVWETATRSGHGLWREAVAEARQDGSLPNSIANKRLAYWIVDGLYAQKPKFGLRATGKPDSPYSKVIPDWVKE